MRRRGAYALCALIAVSVLLLAGCTIGSKANGGGWLPSAAGDGTKANFGFDMKITPTSANTADVKGNLEFHDKSAGIKVHGVPEGPATYDNSTNQALMSGTWSSNGAEGTFQLAVQDNKADGTPDEFGIALFDSSDNVIYTNTGNLSGGNITVHSK